MNDFKHIRFCILQLKKTQPIFRRLGQSLLPYLQRREMHIGESHGYHFQLLCFAFFGFGRLLLSHGRCVTLCVRLNRQAQIRRQVSSFQICSDSFTVTLKHSVAPGSYVIQLSPGHVTAIEDPKDWTKETPAFLDYLRLVEEHIKYIRSREDYQDSFTLSWRLRLKASAAFLRRRQRDLGSYSSSLTRICTL